MAFFSITSHFSGLNYLKVGSGNVQLAKILLVPAKIRNNCGRYYLIINFAIIDFSLLLLVRTLLHCFFSVLLIIAIVGIAITLERTNKKQKTNSGIFYEGADFISRGWSINIFIQDRIATGEETYFVEFHPLLGNA